MAKSQSVNGVIPLTPEHGLQDSSYFRIKYQSIRVILALLIREMTTTFGRSRLGYLWAVLEPIGGIAVLTIGFSFFFSEPPYGESFALFYATGFLPFACYTNCYGQVSSALKSNRMLLFYPAVTFLDVIIARLLLLIMTQATIIVVVFTAIIWIEGADTHINYAAVLGAFFMAIGIGTGVGLINAVLFELVPSWQNLWNILNRPVFFLSCIFYTFDSLPEAAQTYLWWNPLVHVIGQMRAGFYSEYPAGYVSPLYILILTMTLATIGLLNMRAMSRFIMNN